MAKFCSNCGSCLDEKAYICPSCGVKITNYDDIQRSNISNDDGGFGWGILGFFFPLVGLILYLVYKKDRPRTASSVGKGALISFICGTLLYVIVAIIFGVYFRNYF